MWRHVLAPVKFVKGYVYLLCAFRAQVVQPGGKGFVRWSPFVCAERYCAGFAGVSRVSGVPG